MNARAVKLDTAHAIIEELPPWCGGALYRGDDDTVVLVVKLPGSEHVVRLEATPEEASAVIEALKLCVTRSQQARRILEIPTDED